MKAKLILLNFILSWFGLAIDTEHSPLWTCLIVIAWFIVSGVLFLHATRRDYFRDIEKRFNR